MKTQVRIKTWEQMEKEFGLDFGGDIQCDFGFLRDMEQRMPKDRIITVVPYEEAPTWLGWNTPGMLWDISDDMIAEYFR